MFFRRLRGKWRPLDWGVRRETREQKVARVSNEYVSMLNEYGPDHRLTKAFVSKHAHLTKFMEDVSFYESLWRIRNAKS